MIYGMFEDHLFKLFSPLSLTRPVYELGCGALTFLERMALQLPEGARMIAFMRGYLKPLYEWRYRVLEGKRIEVNTVKGMDEGALLINGRLVVNETSLKLLRKLEMKSGNFIAFRDDEVIALRLSHEISPDLWTCLTEPLSLESLTFMKEVADFIPLPEADLVKYPWDLIRLNGGLLEFDCGLLLRSRDMEELRDRNVLGDRGAFLGDGVEIEPYAVLDTRKGPVIVDDGSIVRSGAKIEGPAYIGKNTIIMEQARIRRSSIGDVCRVGGEVEQSIFHGYSNKYHDGFIGHSYIGEWVNVGALTTVSDLKNTYGTVRMEACGNIVDTGMLKVGSFIADMVKTSIGTLIFSGRKIGVSSHVYGVVREDVPSFAIYAKPWVKDPYELDLDKAIEIQRRMKSRRGMPLSDYEVELMRYLFFATSWERGGFERGRFSPA